MPSLPTLHTERCTLRPWRLDDADLLPAIADTRDISWNTSYRFPNPFGPEQAKRYVTHILGSPAADNWPFAVEMNGELIGGCGAHRATDVEAHTAEIGYWLRVDSWGKGIATEVIERLVRFVSEETDIEQVTARCFGWNPASARVLEKLGFRQEGLRRGVVKKWGKRTDLLIFGKLLD